MLEQYLQVTKIYRPIPDRVVTWLKSFKGPKDSYALGELKEASNVSTFYRIL